MQIKTTIRYHLILIRMATLSCYACGAVQTAAAQWDLIDCGNIGLQSGHQTGDTGFGFALATAPKSVLSLMLPESSFFM